MTFSVSKLFNCSIILFSFIFSSYAFTHRFDHNIHTTVYYSIEGTKRESIKCQHKSLESKKKKFNVKLKTINRIQPLFLSINFKCEKKMFRFELDWSYGCLRNVSLLFCVTGKSVDNDNASIKKMIMFGQICLPSLLPFYCCCCCCSLLQDRLTKYKYNSKNFIIFLVLQLSSNYSNQYNVVNCHECT